MNGKNHPSGLDKKYVDRRRGESLEQWAERRGANFRQSWISLPYAGIHVEERSTAQALDFVSLVLVNHSAAVRRLLRDYPEGEGCFFWTAQLNTALSAAAAVARRACWHGLQSAPDAEQERAGAKRAPLFIAGFGGYSGMMPWTDDDLLYHICSAMFVWREEILQAIYPELDSGEQAALLEALVIAETIEDRAGGPTEMDEAHDSNRVTELEARLFQLTVGLSASR